jgi:predicted permease
MHSIATQLPFAARRLLRARAFSLVAIGTLGLAIGSNVAIFSLVQRLFLEELPVREPERLVGVYESRDGAGHHPLSFPDFLAYRKEATTLQGLAAAYLGAPLEVRLPGVAGAPTGDSPDGEPSFLEGAVVSHDYFSVLGLRPEHGRFFAAEEDAAPGREPVAVISQTLWRERFAARREVVGSPLTINDTAFTIVGVAPAEARSSLLLGTAIDVWIPTSMAAVGYRWCDALDPDCTWMSLVGRLAPAATIQDVSAELSVLARRLRLEQPSAGDDGAEDGGRGVSVTPLGALHPAQRSDSLRLAGTLLLAVSILVVVAGASLSGLLVARGLGRRREVAVRFSLGAARSDVLSLFVAETLLIGLAGGGLGLVVAAGFRRLISQFYASREPLELAFGAQTAVYALLLSLAIGLAVGLVPGLQATRPALLPALRGDAPFGRRSRVLGGLVVAQTALALVLVTATGLLARSIDSLRHAGAAEPERIATLRLRPRLVGLDAARAQAVTREVLERLENVPGVRSAALSTHFTPGRVDFTAVSRVAREPARDNRARLEAATQPVSPRFFETLGIPRIAGRDFDHRDLPSSEPVAIVNRTLGASLWPDGPAVGDWIQAFGRRFRVVGVVDDAGIHLDPADAPVPQLYLAYWQDPSQVDSRLVVATTPPAATMLATLRGEIDAVDRRLPVTEVEDMAARLRRTFTPTWLAGRVLGTTGALALLLCALCLHGVLSLLVAQHQRNLGIRLALGATRAGVVSLVLRDALALVGAGVAIGLALSLGLGRLLEAHLFDVSPADPATIAGAILILCLVAGASAWLPARRASRVDPWVVLRAD